MRTVPMIAILLGLAGLIPFVGLGAGALTLTSSDWADKCLLGLIGYSAVILAFLGGVHWGFGLTDGATQTVAARRARFGLGVLPSLIGWAGLAVTFLGAPVISLPIEIAGFIALTVVEARGARAGLVPAGYMTMRWMLSLVVVVFLAFVLVALLLKGRVFV